MFNSLFGHSQSKRWHDHVDKKLPVGCDQQLLEDFDPKQKPWCQIRRATDHYLARKTRSKIEKSDDELLEKLVLERSQKDVAVLACGHAFSTAALRQLLFSGSIAHIESSDGVRTLLQCFHAASLVSRTILYSESAFFGDNADCKTP